MHSSVKRFDRFASGSVELEFDLGPRVAGGGVTESKLARVVETGRECLPTCDCVSEDQTSGDTCGVF